MFTWLWHSWLQLSAEVSCARGTHHHRHTLCVCAARMCVCLFARVSCVRACVCECVRAPVCVRACVRVRIGPCVPMCARACMCAHVRACVFVYVCVRARACMCVCPCVCVCACVCVTEIAPSTKKGSRSFAVALKRIADRRLDNAAWHANCIDRPVILRQIETEEFLDPPFAGFAAFEFMSTALNNTHLNHLRRTSLFQKRDVQRGTSIKPTRLTAMHPKWERKKDTFRFTTRQSLRIHCPGGWRLRDVYEFATISDWYTDGWHIT